ncbi:30S ribosome-binding factor RbfA [Tetragenococcus halophilus]|uniref:Ribosome-binding factor A n=2 Tax=Tetragenococcus halophilus TaxID=51669 RepID=A0A2H6CQG5_TETHA|nr:30S ribosome-binding factor RbfA [Tetragenococcus halophilus]AOF48728.1 ribosome-binding factor A [Tetragenococcus halophilus]AYW50329.1 30S ribosome-binding factor RbfA [Tetragenococcus halophilus]MCF1600790.1 30S ribosome-binding factor RbfA [Tetragenococcus halophilus]MCF1675783.1 30S ribosome-binding factor RbfA [Tetragenococcus halophilus]MCO8285142.1 30S ribosome-binding factor RbfA [Tetragenococcus halophilus]
MANYRDRRVAQEILKEVTHLLQTKIRDPRVQNVTITDVSVTGDLQQATIFYSILSEDASAKQEAQMGLENAKGLIRREVGHVLSIYKTPEIFFELDESVEYGERIDEVIRELHESED